MPNSHDPALHLLPAPVFRMTADLQSRRRLGLTATLAGPLASTAEDLAKLTIGNIQEVARGKDTKAAAEALRGALEATAPLFPPPAPGNDAPFERAEFRLAVFLEQFGDGHARRRLDLVVGIDEGKRQDLRRLAANGRLAGPHQPDQDHATPPEARADRVAVLRGRCGAGIGHGSALSCGLCT